MNNLIIENAEIIYPNFSGREGRYNREGDRNFSVLIPEVPGLVDKLAAEGWNVKPYYQNNEPTGRSYISGVSINFKYYIPPEIHYVSGGRDIVLTEETLSGRIAAQLDGRGAEKVDVSIRPREWERADGSKGIKGYVDEMRIVAKKSLFSSDYVDEDSFMD